MQSQKWSLSEDSPNRGSYVNYDGALPLEAMYSASDWKKRGILLATGGPLGRGIRANEMKGIYRPIGGSIHMAEVLLGSSSLFPDGIGLEATFVPGFGGSWSLDEIYTEGDNRTETYLSVSLNIGFDISSEARVLNYYNTDGSALKVENVEGLFWVVSGGGSASFSHGGGFWGMRDGSNISIYGTGTKFTTVGASVGTPGLRVGLGATISLSNLRNTLFGGSND